jgi:quinol monooxygenase YgiN
MVAEPIGWTVQFKIAPGKVKPFRKIVEELVAALEKAEPGTLMSQWFLSEDETTCRVHVWCAGQDATIAHATGIGPRTYLPKLLELAAIERFDVFGTPNAQLASILQAFPVTSRNRHVGGFSRGLAVAPKARA